jgi:D-alanyl-D-alanine-carboxypeptidase/D-alanyl-D-alanine-endopeptidase
VPKVHSAHVRNGFPDQLAVMLRTIAHSSAPASAAAPEACTAGNAHSRSAADRGPGPAADDPRGRHGCVGAERAPTEPESLDDGAMRFKLLELDGRRRRGGGSRYEELGVHRAAASAILSAMRILLSVVILLACAASAVAAPPHARLRPDREIRQMLVTRVDVQKQATGVVVGIVEPRGRRVITYGTRGLADRRPMTGDTVVDIGSITKLFTSLLLADLAVRGELAIDDPVSRYLPAEVRVPERDGLPITLADLATHTAGLPLRPSNLVSADPDNKYAGYTIERLYEFLSAYALPRTPGTAYEYSNVGYGLLGHVIARRIGKDYAAAVRSRITGPLGMADTRIVPTPAMKARTAVGYTLEMKPAVSWDFGALEGAGALRSTANDLMKLLEACLGYRKTALAPALRVMVATRRPGGMQPSTQIALGWNVLVAGERELVWKNGSVGGYRAFIGFDLAARVGVVALSNAQTGIGVDDIGLHLLDPAQPVDLWTPVVRKAIAVAPELLDRYVGRYRFSPTDVLTFSRTGAQLYVTQEGSQDRVPVFAEGPRAFFLKVIDAQVTFVAAGDGPANAAIWQQGGKEERGERVE